MPLREVSNDSEEWFASGPVPDLAAREDVQIQTEYIQPGAAPRSTQPTKTFFGLAQEPRRQGFSRPVFNDDYVERFPEDPYGQETAPNARIWRVYGEEAAAFDENMVGQSRDGLDVMLVFAGLFSAVVTSLLVQVSQNLQADFSEMSALLLHDLLIVQLSMVDGATVNVTTPSVNPAQKFDPDAIDVWVNGLWVASLTASLIVALAAVLVKQWLHRYMTFPSGTPGLRSHIRQFRYVGLEKWCVRIIIGMLPIIMHISLMLFFAGLALFYIPLRASLAWMVGTLTVLVCILYLVSNTIPIIYPQCPYQTPLTDFIHHVCHVAQMGIQDIRHYCFVAYSGIRWYIVPLRQKSSAASSVSTGAEFGPEMLQGNLKSLTQLESEAVRDAHATLSVDALDWLYQVSSNPTVHTLVLQGMSGLSNESCFYAVTKWSDATDMQSRRHQLVRETLLHLNSASGKPRALERLCRSWLFLPMIDNEDATVLYTELAQKLTLHWHNKHRDPRLLAAIRVASGSSLLTHEFFASHSNVLMHPLIWEDIVENMTISLVRRHFPLSDECTWAPFLYSIIGPPPATSPNVSLMTGTQVIWTRLGQNFWDTILKAPPLVYHDSVLVEPISSYHRTLIAAGKVGLSHVRTYHNNIMHFAQGSCRHLELLTYVVRLIAGPDVAPNVDQWTVDFDFLFDVIVETPSEDIYSWSIEELENGNKPFLSCLSNVRTFYQACSYDSKFHFPRLHFLLHTWAEFYDSTQYDSDFEDTQSSYLVMPVNILGNAMNHGHEEAYISFGDGGWMEIIFTEWAICGGGMDVSLDRVISGYIKGLYTLPPDFNRREFCSYLHRPQQLLLTVMLVVACETKSWFSTEPSHLIERLAKICPTHRSWRVCHTALKAILTWAETPNPDISLFPWPLALQNLSSTAAFRKYPLIKWIARRFSFMDMRICLEEGLETLHAILEADGCVDGILIPDLDYQTTCVDKTLPPVVSTILVAGPSTSRSHQ